MIFSALLCLCARTMSKMQKGKNNETKNYTKLRVSIVYKNFITQKKLIDYELNRVREREVLHSQRFTIDCRMYVHVRSMSKAWAESMRDVFAGLRNTRNTRRRVNVEWKGELWKRLSTTVCRLSLKTFNIQRRWGNDFWNFIEANLYAAYFAQQFNYF